MSYSDGCGYAACTIRRGTATGECRCLGASQICRGGHQDMRKQLHEAVRLLDELSEERDDLRERLRDLSPQDDWPVEESR